MNFMQVCHFDLAYKSYMIHLTLLFSFRQGITNLKLIALTSTTKKVLENLFHVVFPYYVLEIALIQSC